LGSAIKPLAVYGPAFDAGASPATIIGNFPAPIQGWTKSPGYPYIGSSDYIGPLSIRQGIVSSLNVMAVRTLYEYVTPEVGAQYLINMDAVPSKINADGPGLALGTSTLTTIQTAAAFGAIAAGGEYIKPMSFTKVVDGDGNVVLNADTLRETRRIYKESSAYMLVDVLTDAVNRGTGKRARIDNMTVAGKTGTNSDYKSVYFAGMTPYYAAAVWVGHDDPSASTLKKGTGGEYAAPIWQAFMEPIHEGLPNKSIIDTPPSSLGLVRKTVCQVSGLLATDACYADQTGHTPITDWMLDENAPTTMCDMHAAVAICSESGAIATQYCPESSVVGGAVVLINPGTYYDQFTDEELSTGLTNYVRTMLPLDAYVENMTDSYGRCLIHGYEGAAAGETDDGQSNYGDSFQTLRELRLQSQELRAEIKEFIDANSLELSENSKLNVHMTQLDALARGNSPDKLRQGIANARADYEAIRDKYLG
ncbi:MAG: hypothetical protein LBS18_00105, partial [Clostridiales bacterium]|nr:hypothetical protein [Clostridiales bacterium]